MSDAEFHLLCYHQLILLADTDEVVQVDPGHYAPPVQDSSPPFTPVTPRDNRPKDTDKTIYRWNKVPDSDWDTWGFGARTNWINHMRKKYPGMTIVA